MFGRLMINIFNTVIMRFNRRILSHTQEILRSSRRMTVAGTWIAASAFGLLAITAKAEDAKHSYSPASCEFEITFPEEPYTVRKCENENDPKTCYDKVSYTKVYSLDATVNFRVICNPISESVYNEYSAEVMKLTLQAMTKNSVVEEFESSYREEESYKQAGLIGEGHVGRTPTIYIAQMWMGKKSVLSVEAELIGEAMEDADALFSDVLKSVGLKEVGGGELEVDSKDTND